MKAILPLAALLGLFCVTLTSALNANLTQYCEECLRKSATSGHYPHPNRCDAFVQCDVLEKTFRAYEIMCPPGLFFDDRIATCNWPAAVKCNKDCQTKPAIKDAFSCNGFFKCINQQRSSTIEYCPNKQRFSEVQSKCVPDLNCPPKKKPLQCFPNFKLHASDPNKFYQSTGRGWTEQRCAIGTGFNMTTCTCSIILPVNRQVVCELVKLPMVQNLAEQSHDWYVNYGDVVVANGAAEFKPDSYLIVPVVTNNDFGNQILISLSFKLRAMNYPQNQVAVLGNSECKIEPTFTVFVENVNSFSPEVVGRFIVEDKGNAIPVEFRTRINKNDWISVRLVKKLDDVSMTVNSNLVQRRTIPGTIKKQDCALTLGQSFKMGNFTGFMRNVEINKCP